MSLNRDAILATVDAHADELQRLGVKSLGLFGAELHSKTFDAYMDVKFFLERISGRRVDLVLADAIKPRLRSAILGEAVHASRL